MKLQLSGLHPLVVSATATAGEKTRRSPMSLARFFPPRWFVPTHRRSWVFSAAVAFLGRARGLTMAAAFGRYLTRGGPFSGPGDVLFELMSPMTLALGAEAPPFVDLPLRSHCICLSLTSHCTPTALPCVDLPLRSHCLAFR